jgi:transcriptional regulator with XRE-family HTH domain
MANTKLRIKEIAKSRGITLEQLADKLGIRRTSLSQALTRNVFSIEKLSEIADVLDVEIPELFEASQPSSMKCPHCGKPVNVTLS